MPIPIKLDRHMFLSDLNLREGLKAKKRVTGLVLAVILSFVGELVHFVAMWSRCGWRCWQRQYQWEWWDENHEFEKRWTSNTLGTRGDGNKILYLFVDILIPVRGMLGIIVKNNKEMPSLLGSDTDSASSQSGLPRLNMGLPSSIDRLSGTSFSTSSSSSSSLHHSDHYPRLDYGARSCVHQLLSEPAALRKDVEQLPTGVLPGEQCLLFMWFIQSRSWPFKNVRKKKVNSVNSRELPMSKPPQKTRKKCK